MAARVIHFGIDECHRVPLLRRAGYSVKECSSLRLLHTALLHPPFPDVVAFAEREGKEAEIHTAAWVVRSHTDSPIVLFQSEGRPFDASVFSLAIPPFTYPRVWLDNLSGLLERSRALKAESRAIQAEAARLCDEAAFEGGRAALERKRSALLRGFKLPDPFRKL